MRRRFFNMKDTPNNYLTIVALEDGLTAILSTNACEYCVDGDGNWVTLAAGTSTEAINTGQTLSFRGELSPTTSGIGTFTISKKCNLKGNCMSMLFGDNAADNFSLSGKDYAFQNLFSNCTNIVNVSPNLLPATTLESSCYYYMFNGCTSLTTVPELPATTLADYCYDGMFCGCIGLTSAPYLPATTLADYCYQYMFQNCSGLTTAPVLPATTLESGCYNYMFYGCTSLTVAPELPATTLEQGCYRSMFRGCTSLTVAPELPATTLAGNCYYGMFYGCTSLTVAPDLPATTLADSCYYQMFVGCTNLNYIKMLATDISADSCLSNWVDGVASSGTFTKDVTMTSLPSGVSGIPSGWIVESVVNTGNYLTIVALEDGLTAILSTNACEYCVDGDGNWVTLAAGTTTEAINTGQTISFRGELTPASSKGIGTFTISKRCNLKGNCMSMLFGDNATDNFSLSGKNYAFQYLFNICSTIVNVSPNFLPATTLADYCYYYMFRGCTSLTTVPELPATTLADYCYYYMFQECKNLTVAPELPATTLADSCYREMFNGCTSLTVAPDLPATTLADYCYYYMFRGCTSLTTVPELPATTLADYCYGSMFQECKNLTVAPELPATTLADNCYDYMFGGCTSLTIAPNLPATTLADSCYENMFRGCTGLTIAPELPATTLASYCYNCMFVDCNSLTIAPEIPATTLANFCYAGMFGSCTSLTIAPNLPATTLADSCYQYMFQNCSGLTIAPDLPATTLASSCYREMFYGCTGLTVAPVLSATTLADYCYGSMFRGCTSLTTAPELPATTLADSCYYQMFVGCTNLNYIKMLATDISADSCLSNWVSGVASSGTFVKDLYMTTLPTGVSGIPSGWTVENNITITECTSLSITADDVSGRSTQTTIYYTAVVNGIDDSGNEVTGINITGEALSEEFPQNTSTIDTVTRTISYTYMGVTATTTITQGVWINKGYVLDLNNQWQVSSVTNPDSTLYDGVYESFSNKGIDNTAAIMYIDIVGYTDFSLYIRSYAESNYDYVMVSQLDQTIDNGTSYSNTTLVKAHTRGSQTSGTAIGNYKLVEFTGIDGGEHKITVLYRKDSSSSRGDDKGYLIIPKNQ